MDSYLNKEVQKTVIEEYIQQNYQDEDLRGYMACTKPNWKSSLFGAFAVQCRYIGVTDKRIVVIPVTLTGKLKPSDETLDIPLEQVTKFEHKSLFYNLIIHYGQNIKQKFHYAGVTQAKNAKNLVDTFNDLQAGLNKR